MADGNGTLIAAYRLPLEGDRVIVTGTVNVDSLIRIQGILASTNAVINGGHFALPNLQMLSGSSFNGTTLFLSQTMIVSGPGCGLSGVTLNIQPSATITLAPMAPLAVASLDLAGGTSVQNWGQILLADGAELRGGGWPQSLVELQSGSLLSSSGAAVVKGADRRTPDR